MRSRKNEGEVRGKKIVEEQKLSEAGVGFGAGDDDDYGGGGSRRRGAFWVLGGAAELAEGVAAWALLLGLWSAVCL